MNDSIQPPDTKSDIWVLGLLICICLLLCTGRFGNGETPGMIDSAVQMYDTGSFAADKPIGVAPSAWLAAPDGRFFESHDLGGQFMSWLAVASAHRIDPTASRFDGYNPATAWSASVLNNLLAAFTLWFVYRSCRLLSTVRLAVGITLAMLFCSFFAGYCRMVFDVTGAALGVSMAVYGSVRLARAESSEEVREIDWGFVAVGLAIAVLFRFSFLPFSGLTLVVLILLLGKRSPWRYGFAALVIFGACIIPALGFNYLRTGSPIKPPNFATDYSFIHSRPDARSFGKGLLALTFGPNAGLFTYAPWLLLMLLIPLRWKRLPVGGRRFVIGWALSLIGYACLMSLATALAGPIAWGPKYLVVILPALVVVAMISLLGSAKGSSLRRFVLFVMILAGAAVNLPVAVTNFKALAGGAPNEHAQSGRSPAMPAAMWRGVILELRGPGIDRAEWQQRIDSGTYELAETANTTLVPDLPVITQGLAAIKPVRVTIWAVIGLGGICALTTLWLAARKPQTA